MENIDKYEQTLSQSQWIGGNMPIDADKATYDALKDIQVDVTTHPYTYAWFQLTDRFSEEIRTSWKAAAPAKGGKGGKQLKGKDKKEEPKKEVDNQEDDDLDLFGEDNEETQRVAAEAAVKAKQGFSKNKKQVVDAKSLITWDVKPWSEEINLDDLAAEILKIEQNGLFWKTEYKQEPVAFGVNKLVISATVEDNKVSTDDIKEKIEALEDYVMSVNITAFNKIKANSDNNNFKMVQKFKPFNQVECDKDDKTNMNQYFWDGESEDEKQLSKVEQEALKAKQMDEFRSHITEKHVLKIKNLEQIFNYLTKEITCEKGKLASKSERFQKNLPNTNLTYGEVDFTSICEVFYFIQSKYGDFSKPGSKFIDLGHGTGKGVLTGCLIHQFEVSAGIELLGSLQEQSEELKIKYQTYLDTVDPLRYQQQTGWSLFDAVKFQVQKADILQHDWSDYDFILANSTCFELAFMQKIAKKASSCKKGSWFVTLTQKMPSYKSKDTKIIEWDCVMSVKKKMSWGPATLHIHRKVV